MLAFEESNQQLCLSSLTHDVPFKLPRDAPVVGQALHCLANDVGSGALQALCVRMEGLMAEPKGAAAPDTAVLKAPVSQFFKRVASLTATWGSTWPPGCGRHSTRPRLDSVWELSPGRQAVCHCRCYWRWACCADLGRGLQLSLAPGNQGQPGADPAQADQVHAACFVSFLQLQS